MRSPNEFRTSARSAPPFTDALASFLASRRLPEHVSEFRCRPLNEMISYEIAASVIALSAQRRAPAMSEERTPCVSEAN
jgi:hypothetical protein